MSPRPAWLHTPPPTLGLQIDTQRVTAVLVDRTAATPVVRGMATAPIPASALVPSLTAVNVVERDVVVAAVRSVIEQIGGRQRRVALVIPDTAAKVSLLPFEQVPSHARDLEQLVRLQLRKTVPFPVDDAQLAWSRGPARGTAATVVVAAMRRDIVREYEAVCAAAGLHAGTVDLATFNVGNLALLGRGTTAGDTLLVAGPDVADRDGLARELQARLDTQMEALDLSGVASFSERVAASDALVGQIAAPTGLVLREVAV